MAKKELSFTQHLTNFEEEVQSPPQIEKVLHTQLTVLVNSELQKKNLLTEPPSLLNYDGTSWKQEEVFEQLLWDCYSHVFGVNIESLQKQLLVKGNVDGLIRKHVRNFIHDQQREANPIGYAVFTNLKVAVNKLRDTGTVTVEPDEDRILGHSIVRLANQSKSVALIAEIEELIRKSPEWDQAFRTSGVDLPP